MKFKTSKLAIISSSLIFSLSILHQFALADNNVLNNNLSTTNISTDKKIYEMNNNEIDAFLNSIRNKSISERIEIVSNHELGTKYKLDPLGEDKYDKFDNDPLFNFKEVDCVTFCEQTLALSMSNSFNSFVDNLQKIRYKNGQIKMSERNHYFMADWVVNNSSLVKDVTPLLTNESEPLTKTISTQKLLAKYNLTNLPQDREMTIRYIPKSKILTVKDKLKTGDVLVYIQKMPGIFASHTGLIIKKGNDVFFRNATSLKPREVIDVKVEDLQSFLLKSEKNLGISILRLKENM